MTKQEFDIWLKDTTIADYGRSEYDSSGNCEGWEIRKHKNGNHYIVEFCNDSYCHDLYKKDVYTPEEVTGKSRVITEKYWVYIPTLEMCKSCDLFTAYEIENSERNHNNCVKWLANNKSCPYDVNEIL